MEQALFCKSCGFQLTRLLRPVATLAERDRICWFDRDSGTAPIPAGYVLIIAGEMLRDMEGEIRPFDTPPVAWLNLADVEKGAGYTPKPNRRNGCCGMDGCDGPNRICFCGAEIGTERSDCWTWHIFIPHAENTIWIEQ